MNLKTAAAMLHAYGLWFSYRRLAGELDHRPDHALADLGTTRSEIRDFAWRRVRCVAEQEAIPSQRTPLPLNASGQRRSNRRSDFHEPAL